MKLSTVLFSFLLVLLFQVQTSSQVLNGGFENWTMDDPDNWVTTDIPGFVNAVSQSSDAHSGSSSAKLEVVSFGGGPYPPILYAGDDAFGFSVSQYHGSLTGYYKFAPLSANEVLEVIVAMYHTTAGYIGGGAWITNQAASSYTQFSAPIDYLGGGVPVPDTAYISIIIVDTSGGVGTIGTYALLDDLVLGGPADVHFENPVATSFNLFQNYPNPFNPSTKINFSITEQTVVEIIVYDILGNKITTLVNDNYSAGEYSVDFIAHNLPNGIYIAKMNAGKYSKAIKMTLLK
ncbi:MAG TPA: T9SS type A sorting domain-containing protein [Ignavibacteriaceae bacterium]|nr:T9SS type A sorting domain-containing protein [Ignavibacteriaceae bacterium]